MNVHIDDPAQKNAGLFVYAPGAGFLQRVFRWLLPEARFVAAADATEFLPDWSHAHLSSAWQLWDEIVERGLDGVAPPGLGPRFGISLANSARFARQRLIRAHMEEFCAAHSVRYFTKKPVLLLKPAPRWFLGEVAQSFGCDSPGWASSIAMVLCAAVYLLREWVRFANATKKSMVVAYRLMRPRRMGSAGGRYEYDIVFSGHQSASTTNREKLSEPVFWGELCSEVRARTGKSIAVLIFNGTAPSGQRLADTVYGAKGVFECDVARNTSEGLRLLAFAFRAMAAPFWGLRIDGVADDMLAIIAGAVLKSLSPALIVSTNSQMRGDSVFEGAKVRGIRTAMIYYSTNNSPLPRPFEVATVENPALRLMDHDVQFSWGDAMDHWLVNQLGISRDRIARSGPVMFASRQPLNPAASESRNRDVIRVGLFDVTPLTREKAFALGVGLGTYLRRDCLGVFRMVVDACNSIYGEKWELVVKFKRAVNPGAHDARYVDELSGILAEMGERVVRFPPDHNPWGVLSVCDVVIGFPYTSMVDAGVGLHKPSCFLYTASLLADRHASGIPGFCDLDSFKRWLAENAPSKDRHDIPSLLGAAFERVLDLHTVK